MIRGVHHTSLSTRNFDAMLHFYRDLLGLPFVISYDWSIGSTASDKCVGLKDSAAKTALLRAGNTYVEIFEYLSPIGAPAIPNRRACDVGITHICFDVVDVIGEYERLAAAGVKFHTPPVEADVFRTTYGRDPDGNIFELQEVLSPLAPQRLTNLVPDIVTSTLGQALSRER
jgi:glyoxylase I family protein